MKILIFYQNFATPKGAWGTRIYEFAKDWIHEGHEVTVVTSVYAKSDLKANKLIETQIIDGIIVKVIGIKDDNKHSKIKRMGTFLSYATVASWYALILGSDVVIASSGPITVGIPGLIAKFFTKKKLIYEVRDLWPETAIDLGIIKSNVLKKVAFYFARLLYKNASLVVGLSKGMEDYIRANFKHKSVITITNSSNLNLFGIKKEFVKNEKLRADDFYGIYTGNIGQTNNSIWLVNTARILKEKGIKDIKIVLIGDGQQKDEICNIIKEEKLNNLIHFNLMSKQDLVAYMQHANISFVPLRDVPILDTSSPNKFFESLAAGIPVIQTTFGWIKDYLESNRVGFTIDGNSASALADLLIVLRTDKRLIAMKHRARKCAVRDFDQAKLSKRYLSAILSIQ